jgi:hypothetical protein
VTSWAYGQAAAGCLPGGGRHGGGWRPPSLSK